MIEQRRYGNRDKEILQMPTHSDADAWTLWWFAAGMALGGLATLAYVVLS